MHRQINTLNNMKAKVLIFVVLATIFAACNSNEPKSKVLLGTWSEPLGFQVSVRTLTFNADGSAVYATMPDTTMSIYPTGGVIYGHMNYVALDNRLCFKGNGVKFDVDGSPVDTIPFEFFTDFLVEKNKLIIDSFAYDGGINSKFIKPLILHKQ